jgi:uncharacterized membrane protein YfcA
MAVPALQRNCRVDAADVPAPKHALEAATLTWEFTLAGLLIGLLVGITGMGGGSLMTPLLVIVFGFEPSLAIGTDILHGAIFKTVGAFRHRRLGNVQARLSGWMFLGSAPMATLGVSVAVWLKHHYGSSVTSVQGRILGAALIFGGLGLLAKSFLRAKAIADGPFVLTRRDRLAAFLIGLFGGFIVGLTSVGSGTFFGLTMLFVFPLRARKVVGTDIFHAAALLYVAGFSHLIAGNVDLRVVAWLLLGSIPGVVLGSQWMVRMPEMLIRTALAVVLLLSGVKLLALPDADITIAIVLGGGALILLASALLRRARGRRVDEASAEVQRDLSSTDDRVRVLEPLPVSSRSEAAHRPS